MMNVNHDLCPEDVLDLLPWYPDGGLSDDERGLVESHAALCSDCRAEIQSWERGPGALPEDAPSAERVLARVFERIADPTVVATQTAESARPSGATTSPSGATSRPSPAHGSVPGSRQDRGVVAARTAPPSRRQRLPARWWYGQAAAAVLALAAGLAGGRMIEWTRTPGEATYETATAPLEPASARDPVASPTLDVVLRDDVPAGRVGEVLRAVGAQIVSGPSAVGRYQLRLAPGTDAMAVAKLLSAPGTGVAAFAQPLP